MTEQDISDFKYNDHQYMDEVDASRKAMEQIKQHGAVVTEQEKMIDELGNKFIVMDGETIVLVNYGDMMREALKRQRQGCVEVVRFYFETDGPEIDPNEIIRLIETAPPKEK